MKISYDPEVDALSITFRETTVRPNIWPRESPLITTAKAGWPGWRFWTRKNALAELKPCAASNWKASTHETVFSFSLPLAKTFGVLLPTFFVKTFDRMK
jgi:hypothetical protein